MAQLIRATLPWAGQHSIIPGYTSSEAVQEVWAPEALEANAQRRIFKRGETGDDLIGTVLFLCSDASAFITGQAINVDGGPYMH